MRLKPAAQRISIDCVLTVVPSLLLRQVDRGWFLEGLEQQRDKHATKQAKAEAKARKRQARKQASRRQAEPAQEPASDPEFDRLLRRCLLPEEAKRSDDFAAWRARLEQPAKEVALPKRFRYDGFGRKHVE